MRELYSHADPVLALVFVERLADDMCDPDNPIEVRSLGRTLRRWKDQIAAWHRSHVSNGPTEAPRVRVHELSQLSDEVTALRGRTELGTARDDHTPVKSEAPVIRSGRAVRCPGTSGSLPRRAG